MYLRLRVYHSFTINPCINHLYLNRILLECSRFLRFWNILDFEILHQRKFKSNVILEQGLYIYYRPICILTRSVFEKTQNKF